MFTLCLLDDRTCVCQVYNRQKKTYNNAISALRRAFEFGYRDYPEKRDPAAALKSARIGKKDRPVIDFFTATGEPIRRLAGGGPCSASRSGIASPTARHSSVSCDLMIGRHPLWVAQQHGHSLLTMLRVYAASTADAPETVAAAIREAMGDVPAAPADCRLQTRLAVDLSVADGRIEPRAGKSDKNDGGEGGIRTHVPVLPDHPISSRRRYDRFGTSPACRNPSKTPHYG